MDYPLTYVKLAKCLWAVYINGHFIGEVRQFPSGWLFHSFKPHYVSEAYAPSRKLAVIAMAWLEMLL